MVLDDKLLNSKAEETKAKARKFIASQFKYANTRDATTPET